MNLPKNVSSFQDRHGITRYRFRYRGRSRYILEQPGTLEFDLALEEARVGLHTPEANPAKPRFCFPDGQVVYFIAAGETSVKIGTTGSLRKRLIELGTASPFPLKLLAWTAGGACLERLLHNQFKTARRTGEWFERVPALDQLIDELSNLKKSPNRS